MSFPMELESCLALAPTGLPLVVQHIPFASLRATCAARGVAEGDAVCSLGGYGSELLVERADGEIVRLEQRYALMIEVEPR